MKVTKQELRLSFYVLLLFRTGAGFLDVVLLVVLDDALVAVVLFLPE